MILSRCAALLSSTVFVSSLAAHRAPEVAIREGASSFAHLDSGVGKRIAMTVWTYRPTNLDPDAKIVFVLHGAGRDAKRYRDQLQPHSESHEFLLVVPEFDARSFSEYEYQRGNLDDAQGRVVERSRWTFYILERLFDVVRAAAGLRATRYSLYGHSAGAQFVHRFVLFMPDARYERAIAANAGWYTMPTFETSFPYGLAATSATQAELKRAMGRELVVMLGEEDVDDTDPDLRGTERARAQGRTRLARGESFHRTALATAARIGVDLRWRRIVVRGAGHSNREMAEAAVAILVQ